MSEEGNAPGFPSAGDFIRVAFADGAAFSQLCFFSGGVPREALQIASLAASLAQDAPISDADVTRSNRDYFRRDKERRLSGAANTALNVGVVMYVGAAIRAVPGRDPPQPSQAGDMVDPQTVSVSKHSGQHRPGVETAGPSTVSDK